MPPHSTPPRKKTDDIDRANLPANYLDIPLQEIGDEVPVYENVNIPHLWFPFCLPSNLSTPQAAAIRRKLNKLLETKSKIPTTNKPWTKTALSTELQKTAQAHHPIKSQQGVGNHGPSLPALSRFLKKSGGMGGGNSESYYFGKMLLEKLRIWNDEKKTKAREKAEAEFPNGRARNDPEHMWIICRADERPTYSELANFPRRLDGFD
ncbi:hypothetical protein BDV95DRAFT_589886 [Massariosphaeria phaeospora]|uniref:Uncharacterized protein n=1 Tax=Massariosphaeria phaeospora TaxID=100035 RepID=A0A7C8IGU4_9PLEO|nr:hypothetical protein BDV95DRAFT_589886 [Massariosphaeria phaeospora]